METNRSGNSRSPIPAPVRIPTGHLRQFRRWLLAQTWRLHWNGLPRMPRNAEPDWSSESVKTDSAAWLGCQLRSRSLMQPVTIGVHRSVHRRSRRATAISMETSSARFGRRKTHGSSASISSTRDLEARRLLPVRSSFWSNRNSCRPRKKGIDPHFHSSQGQPTSFFLASAPDYRRAAELVLAPSPSPIIVLIILIIPAPYSERHRLWNPPSRPPNRHPNPFHPCQTPSRPNLFVDFSCQFGHDFASFPHLKPNNLTQRSHRAVVPLPKRRENWSSFTF